MGGEHRLDRSLGRSGSVGAGIQNASRGSSFESCALNLDLLCMLRLFRCAHASMRHILITLDLILDQ
jgi:hypothetical protein